MHTFIQIRHLARLFVSGILLLSAIATLQAQNYYTVKFPDDRSYIGCGYNVPVEMPVITQQNGCSFNVGISRTDQVFSSNAAGTCFKIIRRWKLIYWCDYNPNWPAPLQIINPDNTDIGPTVVANNYNHGYLEYVQVIKVRDDKPPFFLNCPASPVLFCDFTNDNINQYGNRCEGPVDLKIQASDSCSGNDITLRYILSLDLDGNGSMETVVNSSSANAWPIQQVTLDQVLQGSIVFPANYGLPYGKHKIEWIAGDNCGNERVCKYEFEVRDCKKPTVTCLNGLSINIMQTGMITLWATDFLQYATDNCTPSNLLKIGIRKAGTGSGFPTNSTSVTFDCTEVGQQFVEIWALDEYGNADYCLTYVNVQDNSGSCPSSSISGSIMTPNDQPISGAQVVVQKAGQTQSIATVDSTGSFVIAAGLTPGCDYTITPGFNTLAKTGVTVYDALLAEAHALNTWPLQTAWQVLAANVQPDSVLNATDATAIAQVALGIQTAFPASPTWQFVTDNVVFDTPNAALTTSHTATVTTCLTTTTLPALHFMGVKMGDIDASGVLAPTFTAEGEERSERARALKFRTQDIEFEAGQQIQVPILTPDLNLLSGFQFTLDFNPAFLTLEHVESGLVSPALTGVFNDSHQITGGWHHADLINILALGSPDNQVAYTLTFNALQAGKLSNVLAMTAGVAVPEAYTRQLGKREAQLQFDPATPQLNTPVVGLNVLPNPVRESQSVWVAVDMPTAGELLLRWIDGQGSLLQQQAVAGRKGYNGFSVKVPASAEGVLMLQAVTAEGVATKRVVIQH